MLRTIARYSVRYLVWFTITSSVAWGYSQNKSEIIALERAKELNLHKHHTWLKLLYLNNDGRTSAVTSEEYFLNPDRHIDARLEMLSTIKAFFDDWPADPNNHAICRFPARYYWLSQHINQLKFDQRIEERCPHLNFWGEHHKTKSVSLILVGSYLGNPASSFGHALLKFDSEEETRAKDLLSKTINFGANVPDDVSMLDYVIKGVFGGYKASFSNQYYATQDHVYRRTEFRDMWEYKLNLSEYQTKLLLLHAWEIDGKEFDYYFFDDNCAYRIAQLVELVTDAPLATTGKPWYLPEALFINLRKDHGIDLVREVNFVPSYKRSLYEQMDFLNRAEINIFTDIIEANDDNSWAALSELSLKRQIIILDTLLAYHQYLLVSQNNQSDAIASELKKRILIARLSLPSANKTTSKTDPLPSPASGSRESTIDASYFQNELEETGLVVGASAYRRDHMSRHLQDGNELVLLDLSASIIDSKLDLNELHVIKVTNLAPEAYTIGQDMHWAWQIDIGARKDLILHDIEYFAQGGIGESYAISENMLGYALIGPYLHSNGRHLSLGGKMGITYLTRPFSLSTYFEAALDKDGNEKRHGYLKFSVALSYASQLFFEASDRDNTKILAGLSFTY